MIWEWCFEVRHHYCSHGIATDMSRRSVQSIRDEGVTPLAYNAGREQALGQVDAFTMDKGSRNGGWSRMGILQADVKALKSKIQY